MNHPEPGRIDGKRVYEGLIINVDLDRVALPGHKQATLEMVRHPGASAVIPLHEDGRVTLIRQYRYAADGWIWEIPAGKRDRGEDPEACALREVEEETGWRAGSLLPLGFIYTTPGFTDEVIHLFVARDLARTEQTLDHDEVITTRELSWDEVLEMIVRGEIPDSKSQCALLRLDQERRAGRITF